MDKKDFRPDPPRRADVRPAWPMVMWNTPGRRVGQRDSSSGREARVARMSEVVGPSGLLRGTMLIAIAMGVRHRDTALVRRVGAVLERRCDDVRRILEEYGVPLVPETREAT